MNDNMMMNLIESVEVNTLVGTLNKISQIQAAIQSTLKQGHDYDTIPGTSKPTLLKPGAEKILMMFGLTSEYEFMEKIEDYNKGVFAYTIRCVLSKNGSKITEGVGSCNSKENKYRWRWTKEEDLPQGIDKDALKKKSNRWGKIEYQTENDEIYSQANTILKMAKKRAQVDATLTVASLSELFTQDIEDMKEFVQQESIETMTDVESQNIKIDFGKYKGKTLGQINKDDPGYLLWLSEKAKDEVVKKAASMVIKASATSQAKEETKTTRESSAKPQQESLPVDEETGEVWGGDQGNEDDLPW